MWKYTQSRSQLVDKIPIWNIITCRRRWCISINKCCVAKQEGAEREKERCQSCKKVVQMYNQHKKRSCRPKKKREQWGRSISESVVSSPPTLYSFQSNLWKIKANFRFFSVIWTIKIEPDKKSDQSKAKINLFVFIPHRKSILYPVVMTISN